MRYKRPHSFWLTGLLLLPAFLHGLAFPQENRQDIPRVRARLDTTCILIGDQIRYHVEAWVPANSRVVFPALNDSLTRGVEVLEIFPSDSQRLDHDAMHYRSRYLITSFDSGFHFIPSQPVVVMHTSRTDTLFTRSLPLEVKTLPPDSSVVLYDIKSPYGVPLTLRELLPYIGAGIILVLLGFLVLQFLRRRKKRETGEEQEVIPPEAAHIIAIRELKALEKDRLWQQGKVKEYHTRLTEILRNYLECRYGIPALEQTTGEIMDALDTRSGISQRNSEDLREILVLADLVKFARVIPEPDENRMVFARAIRFVQETIAVDVHEEDENVHGLETGETGGKAALPASGEGKEVMR
ncbi:MAG TPA: hypothetical protein ENN63_09050 [Bacteroidetes bacterium]|nr:hypothetical protein [Bacteroidota bacterium]